MLSNANDNNCHSCGRENKKEKDSKLSFLSSLLVIIIPKCPFCIMAFSSAMTVCGGQSYYMSHNNWVSLIPLVLAAVVVVMIARNFRDIRTFLALAISIFSTIMLILSHQLIISEVYFTIGSIMLVFSVWLNGSFISFVNFVTKKVNKISLVWQK